MENLNLLNNAHDVADGAAMPSGTSAAYGAVEVAWAEHCAKPNETVQEAHARLVARRGETMMRAVRIAGGIARMFEGDCDPRPLLSALGFKPGEDDWEYESRLDAWAGLFDLAKLARLEHEALGDCLRRLVDENGAARCAYFYVVVQAKPRA